MTLLESEQEVHYSRTVSTIDSTGGGHDYWSQGPIQGRHINHGTLQNEEKGREGHYKEGNVIGLMIIVTFL